MAGVSLRDRVRRAVIHERLEIKLLLLYVEPVEVVRAYKTDASLGRFSRHAPAGKRPQGRPRTRSSIISPYWP